MPNHLWISPQSFIPITHNCSSSHRITSFCSAPRYYSAYGLTAHCNTVLPYSTHCYLPPGLIGYRAIPSRLKPIALRT